METGQQTRRVPERPPPPNVNVSTSSSRPVLSIDSVNNFQDLQNIHDAAHKFVHSGLKADERNDPQDAMRCYSEGLRLINIASRVDCEQLSSKRDQIDQGKQMQQKMTKTKQQITFRIQDLQSEYQSNNDLEARMEADGPPSYEDAMREPSAPPDFMDDEMIALGDSIMNGEMDHHTLTDASELLTIEDGVQIFYISPDGLVSAPSYPSSLHVVKMPENSPSTSDGNSSPPAFIHVNDWAYPLVPGTSPVLQTRYGAYIFPDLMSNQPGAAVGLVLPDTVSPQMKEKFEQTIRSLTVFETQPSEAEPAVPQARQDEETSSKEVVSRQADRQEKVDTSTKISQGISVAADWISWGLGKSAEKAGELLRAGSEKIRERTKPGIRDRKVDPRIQKGLVCARQATHATVQVTGYLVSKLGEATSALAREFAPHLRAKGEKIIPKSMKSADENGKSKLDGVVEVAASGLRGFGTVYIGLETAAKTLGKSLANETVKCVHHKYGAEASQMTEHTMYTAGNAAMTAFNANNFGVKAIAKRAAKDTGKALVEDLNKNKIDHRGYVPCESTDDGDDGRNGGGAVGGAGYPRIKQ